MLKSVIIASALTLVSHCANSWDELSPKFYQYQIIYDNDNTVPRSKALQLTLEQASNHSYEVVNYGHLEYICLVPTLNYTLSLEEEQQQNDLFLSMNSTEQNRLKRDEKLMISDRLITLHKTLAKDEICAIHTSGYWAYEFCFDNDFIQYHYVRDGPVRDQNGPTYRLGRISKSMTENNFEIVEGENDGNSYVSQLIDQGSICDLTGKPRSTFVQYKCGKGLARPVIENVAELKSCQYQVVILVPELCDLEVFQPKSMPVYDLNCQLIEAETKPEERLNLIDYKLIPLGYNIFIGVPKFEEKLTVLFTNSLTPNDTELLKQSINFAFMNAIGNSQFKVPGYVARVFLENDESAAAFSLREKPGLINMSDKFIYISKLYDVTGMFIDNIDLYFDSEIGSSLSFGKEEVTEEDTESGLLRKWYGTSVESDELPMGNFIMFNGIRFKGVAA